MKTQQSAHDELPGTTGTISSAGSKRRRFLTRTTCVASAFALPAVGSAAAAERATLTASDFRSALHTRFRATALSHPALRVASLTLSEVIPSRHPHPSLDKSRAAEMVFSLKFSVNETGFAQDTYLLSHPVLGDFAALLVPTPNGSALHAEFHRL